jgi:hypothetical protein
VTLAPLCRAELPSTATPERPIRCSKREQCQRHQALLRPGTWPFGAVPWACDRNSFDAFVPLASAVKA